MVRHARHVGERVSKIERSTIDNGSRESVWNVNVDASMRRFGFGSSLCRGGCLGRGVAGDRLCHLYGPHCETKDDAGRWVKFVLTEY